MIKILLFFLSTTLYGVEKASISYDLIFSLAEKYGVNSIKLRQIIPTDDFETNVELNGQIIEPVAIDSFKYVKFQLKREYCNKGYMFVSNQPKGSMRMDVITNVINFETQIRNDNEFPVDQFKQLYTSNLMTINNILSTTDGKNEKPLIITFNSINYLKFSAKVDGDVYATENGSLEISLSKDLFDKGIKIVFDKTDIKFGNK